MTNRVPLEHMPDIFTNEQAHLALKLSDAAHKIGQKMNLSADEIHDALILASTMFHVERIEGLKNGTR